ncbi:uncharacterized protein LOC108344961 isoform X1 [Vigna angularis]|uniref:uncharacterized protein LOC108344961 isoform X1 n=1 Tax=Phaseolus angularis TaxID=3914 RepID=UPI0022B59668|nr:uncharacterized protein LOC108344961 isoform X1 [Vigna angularis]
MSAGSSRASFHGDSPHGSPFSKFDVMKAFQQMQHQLDAMSKRLDADTKAKGKQSHGHEHGSSKKKQEDKALDPNLAMPKLSLPSFKGDTDPSVFLEWIAKVEQVFSLYDVDGPLRVKLACLALEGYAKQWLNRRYLTMASPASTWEHCRDILYQRFVPPYYHRDLLIKLQRLTQGRRSVEEYARELKVLLYHTNTKENDHAKIVRFISGLNRNIQDVLKLHDDETLDVVVHRAMKVEKKLLQKEAFHNKISKDVFYKSSSSKDKAKNVSKEPTNKSCPHSSFNHSSSNHSSSPSKSPSRPSHIKCFKCLGHGHIASSCPNKRVVCIREEEVVINESTSSSPTHTYSSSSSPSEEKEKVMLHCLNKDIQDNQEEIVKEEHERKEKEEKASKEKEEIVREKEKANILITKEVLLQAPSPPIIQLDPSYDRGVFPSFHFSPNIKLSSFPKNFCENIPSFSSLITTSSHTISNPHLDLMYSFLHLTQDKNKSFSKEGFLVFLKQINQISKTHSFNIPFPYTLFGKHQFIHKKFLDFLSSIFIICLVVFILSLASTMCCLDLASLH